MDCRFRRDSLSCGTQENDSDYPLGMERCLKKLVLDAEAMGFGDSERAAGSRWDPLGEKPCPEGSVEGQRAYTVNRRRVKKLIPA